ncbi:MAG TPA: GNAT family N-acetyltransferase [Mycobacterium sp.]|nr:GNAT family N-acetyltransferase [Mycobacterium sp.]
MGTWRIDILTGPDAVATVEPVFREYLDWMLERFARDLGIDEVDPDGSRERAYFAETLQFLEPPGRLLVARLDGDIAGVGALKPTDIPHTAEIKRMFVRPAARGKGIARALFERLLSDARAAGCTSVRLETLSFMTEAQLLYRSVGAVETGPFEGSEAVRVGLEAATTYLRLEL